MATALASIALTAPVERAQGEHKLRYRPDIDGLRAIAVLSVVAYHFDIPFFGLSILRGGYVGVDVFFVLSGYLIGGNMIEQLRAGEFSLVGFYERRFRRILPALFVMLAIVSALMLPAAMPSELVAFAWTLGSATLSVSNIWFSSHANYFAGVPDIKPLLHSWSLAVEDQFYLFFPMLLLLLWRRRLALAFCAIAFASLFYSTFLALRTPQPAFYLLTSRAWELLLGFLAYQLRDRLPETPIVREVLAVAGLALLFAGMQLCAFRPPFPGVTALPTTLGTAILLAIGSHAPPRLNRALASAPLVGIGLISYSVYLWHWPVLVLSKTQLQLPLNTVETKLTAFALTLVLAYLSWRFVEQPFRDRSRFGRRSIFALAAVSAVLLLTVAGTMIGLNGLPGRLPPEALRMASFLDYNQDKQFRTGQCFLGGDEREPAFDLPRCTPTHPGRPHVLIMGDSHAAQLWYGFDRLMTGSDIWQVTGAGCRATLDTRAQPQRHCKVWAHTLSELFTRAHPDLVVMTHNWQPRDLPLLDDTLKAMRRQRLHVIVVGPEPSYEIPLPTLLAHQALTGRPSATAFLKTAAYMEHEVAGIAARDGASFQSLEKWLCNAKGDSCTTLNADGSPLLFDNDHLTPSGSIAVARFFLGSDPALVPASGKAQLGK